MTKFILTETEKIDSNYKYTEEYDTYEKAYERMRKLYHDVAVLGNPDAIEKSEIFTNSAYVELNDGNVIAWGINECNEE